MRNEAPSVLAEEWAARTNAETRAFMGVSVRLLFPSEAPGLPFEQRVELALAEAREILRAACVIPDDDSATGGGGTP